MMSNFDKKYKKITIVGNNSVKVKDEMQVFYKSEMLLYLSIDLNVLKNIKTFFSNPLIFCTNIDTISSVLLVNYNKNGRLL